MPIPLLHILMIAFTFLGAHQDVDPPEAQRVRSLLDRMAKAHESVEVFVSPLTYRKEYGLEGDFETRIGVVSMKGEGSGREMALVFDRIIDVSGHGTDQAEFHMFKDGWWTELDPRRKRYVRRQIVEAGSATDPFQLGEGPLPLPLNQDPDTVLDRFEVTMGSVPDEPLFRTITEAEVLHLVPRKGTPAFEDHESIDLLFEKTTLLPIGIRLSHRNGDRTTAWMRKPSAQADGTFLDERRLEEFKKLRAAVQSEPGWTVETKPLAPSDPPRTEVEQE